MLHILEIINSIMKARYGSSFANYEHEEEIRQSRKFGKIPFLDGNCYTHHQVCNTHESEAYWEVLLIKAKAVKTGTTMAMKGSPWPGFTG